MPEGPTLHRLARDHTQWLAGQTLTITSPQGRFADAANLLTGSRLTRAEAWGKHLFYDFAGGRVMHVHLGLYGTYRVHENPPPAPRGAVRVRMTGRAITLDLNGPNQCEVIDATARDDVISRLGPDPLRADADPAKAWDRIHASRQPIGQLLMDQSVVAGIGNIYRAELLWLARLHPRTAGRALTKTQFNRIWRDSQRLMQFAVDFGNIITTRNRRPLPRPPARLTRDQRFNIYKLTRCPRCSGAIEQYTLVGRTVHACAGCQVVQAADD